MANLVSYLPLSTFSSMIGKKLMSQNFDFFFHRGLKYAVLLRLFNNFYIDYYINRIFKNLLTANSVIKENFKLFIYNYFTRFLIILRNLNIFSYIF